MDKKQKLDYQREIEKYLESKKVYELFEDLMKSLVIAKPEDPINYMIQKLSEPERTIIFTKTFSLLTFINREKDLCCWTPRIKCQRAHTAVGRLFGLRMRLSRWSIDKGDQ